MNRLAARIRGPGLGRPPLWGPPPRNERGVELDLRTHAVLQLMRLSGRSVLHDIPVERARRDFRQFAPLGDMPPRASVSVERVELPGPSAAIPARVYRPEPSGSLDGTPQLPTLVFLHGGGFVIGGSDTHDGVCQTLAADACCVVVSVDYRLAPEHPYPAALDDALAAMRHIVRHASEFGGRPDRVAIAGDSAGGNLAAVVCQRLRDAGEAQPILQALIYPCTDLRVETRLASHREFSDGFLLTTALLDWFLAHYLPDPELAREPNASPALATDLRELAPALVLTAGFDPLRDEGQAYAAALARAGVRVEHRCHSRLIHGFFTVGGMVPAAREAVIGFADRLRVELHRERIEGRA